MASIRELLSRLTSNGVEYVIVGGVAARLHGSTMATKDVDICCRMNEANLARLISALQPLHPKFRFHPKRPPLQHHPRDLAKFNMLNLSTDLADLDVMREVEPVGSYEQVLQKSVVMEIDGAPARVLDLDSLIAAKSAAARVKDKLGLIYLDSLKKRLAAGEQPPQPEL